MDKVTVYRFEKWDLAAGKKEFASRMATRETIKRVRGEADLDSALLVDRSNIDDNGYFASTSTQLGA